MLKYGHIKNDILASVVVFFVAIPLCLGIALASGASMLSGVLTGVIGGIIVGFLSESQVSVSGPAAGMITVVLTSVSQIGSYEGFLLALVIAGALQIISGILRAGFIANFVPSNVIQGLLAAIGILIIIKQLPFALGYFSEAVTLRSSLEIAQETLSLSPIMNLLTHINLGATIISIISFIILFFWQKIPYKAAKIFPPAFAVVIMGIVVNFLFHYFIPVLELHSAHLVNIPIHENMLAILEQFKHPDFYQITNSKIYIYAFMIAIVASLETLLNLEAIEKIDKRHRYCSRDRELVAQGVGNIVSGLVGGLPITSVIVRSSVNISAGARTKLSTISHGVILLMSLTWVAESLNYIPICALAAILIHTGYKLARISLFKEVYKEGMSYFIPFIITIIAIVFSNLLLGIIIGLSISIFFILRQNNKNCFTIVDEKRPGGDILRLLLPQQVTFLNKAAIIEGLNQIPSHSKVIIDAKITDYIDNDILGVIKDFRDTQAVEKNILVNLEGFKRHYQIAPKRGFLTVTTYDVQASLTPEKVLTILREGNNRFCNKLAIHKNYKQQVTATSEAQYPIAIVLGCMDSRVPIELIFDLNIGDVFVLRIAGNVGNQDIIGSIEFACKVAGAKLIVVLGHTGCGAIKASCEDVELGHLTQLLEKIKPAVKVEEATQHLPAKLNDDFLLKVTYNNVHLTKEYIYRNSKILKEMINNGQIGIVGAFYDVKTGVVKMEDNISQPEKMELT